MISTLQICAVWEEISTWKLWFRLSFWDDQRKPSGRDTVETNVSIFFMTKSESSGKKHAPPNIQLCMAIPPRLLQRWIYCIWIISSCLSIFSALLSIQMIKNAHKTFRPMVLRLHCFHMCYSSLFFHQKCRATLHFHSWTWLVEFCSSFC